MSEGMNASHCAGAFPCRGRLHAAVRESAPRQSQRDCVLQPRVARHVLPWVAVNFILNPNGVVSGCHPRATTPLGLLAHAALTQGSACRATLGFEPESLRDSNAGLPGDFEPRHHSLVHRIP